MSQNTVVDFGTDICMALKSGRILHIAKARTNNWHTHFHRPGKFTHVSICTITNCNNWYLINQQHIS